jgi:hypothetical protein
MNRRLRIIAALLALTAVITAAGSHWVLLQSVAWTGMFFRYASEGNTVEALEKTFDGRHPCALCHTVRAGRQEQDQPTYQFERAPELNIPPKRAQLPEAPTEPPQAPSYLVQYYRYSRPAPPTPPPRLWRFLKSPVQIGR